MNLQKVSRVLHRDVGYFLTVLTMLYAVSGIAVNHVEDWNHSYSITTLKFDIGALGTSGLDGMESVLTQRLGLTQGEIRGRHLAGPGEFKLFLPEGGEAVVDPRSGQGTLKRVKRRPLLFEANVLHLNHLKGLWTYVADAFSLLLFGLALTGLFILKGPNGFFGRGKWFLAAGGLIPIAFVVYYNSTR